MRSDEPRDCPAFLPGNTFGSAVQGDETQGERQSAGAGATAQVGRGTVQRKVLKVLQIRAETPLESAAGSNPCVRKLEIHEAKQKTTEER